MQTILVILKYPDPSNDIFGIVCHFENNKKIQNCRGYPYHTKCVSQLVDYFNAIENVQKKSRKCTIPH